MPFRRDMLFADNPPEEFDPDSEESNESKDEDDPSTPVGPEYPPVPGLGHRA